jgi:pseudomonalisin
MKRYSAVSASIYRLTVAMLLVAQLSYGQTSNRIVAAIDPNDRVQVAGTVPPTSAYVDRGPADPSTFLSGLTLNIRLSAGQEADLDALTMAQLKHGSKSYHEWLTRDEYAARFGLTVSDLTKLTQWMGAQGLTVDRIGRSRNAIHFSGPVSQIDAALQTEIHRFSAPDGAIRYANITEVSVPRAISGMIAGVSGFGLSAPRSDHRFQTIKLPTVPQTNRDHPLFTSPTTNFGNHFLAPGDIAAIYGINPLYMSGYTGAGQQIAVVGQSNYLIDDISAFRNAAGLPVQTINYACISTSVPCTGNSAISPDSLAEAEIDLEWAGAIAQNATLNYIYAAANDTTMNANDALQYAIQDYTVNGKVVPIVSYSFAQCEQQFAPAAIATFESVLKQAATQGQTVFASAGDAGSAACDYSLPGAFVTAASHGLAVAYPASSVYVLSVGGTEFTADGALGQTDNSMYWNSSNSVNPATNLVSSATGYIPESAWNDSPYSIQNNGGLAAGGGGYSALFNRPSWQSGISSPFVANDGPRDVPDIAMAASALHDPYLFCTQMLTTSGNTVTATNGSNCQNGFYNASNNIMVDGGTSVAAPVAAGIFSLIEQDTGQSYGVVASELYSIASNPDAYSSPGGTSAPFNIIQPPIFAGGSDNDVPCTAGSPDCVSGILISSAQPGQHAYELSGTYAYNLAVGLGSVNASNLAGALGGTNVGPSNKSFTLSGGAATVAGSGTTTAAVAITPVNGYEGTVDLSCAITTSPTGAVDVPTCAITSPTVISSSSGATATLTIATGGGTAKDIWRWFRESGPNSLFLRGGSALATVLFFWIPRRRSRGLWRLTILALVAAVGCGGGGGNSPSSPTSPTQPTTPMTTTGSYIVTVTGVDSVTASITSKIAITVTVQ